MFNLGENAKVKTTGTKRSETRLCQEGNVGNQKFDGKKPRLLCTGGKLQSTKINWKCRMDRKGGKKESIEQKTKEQNEYGEQIEAQATRRKRSTSLKPRRGRKLRE